MAFKFKKLNLPAFDGFMKAVGLKDKTLSHETDKGMTEGPLGGPSVTPAGETPEMPGSSTGEAAAYHAGIGQPGDSYPASWGVSVTCNKRPRT